MRKVILLCLLLTSCGRIGPHRPISYRYAKRVLIVLDAGHGDHDQGAVKEGYEEKNLALATTLMTRDHLQKFGYHIVLTREDDTFVPLKQRSALANEQDAQIFVSIHMNASTNPLAHGVEVYRWRTDERGKREAESEKLANAILNNIIRYTGVNSRGVKEANLSVLRRTEMPAVLVEAGFMTNRDELSRLKETSYLNSISWGITQGINQYLRESCHQPR